MKNKCLIAIERETDYIVDLLLKEVTPKEVCLALGFCFAHTDVVELVPLPEVKPKPKPNPYVCRVCQVVVKKVEDELNNKTAQEDIENCVKQACNAVPNSFRTECKKFIDAYANEIIKHLPSESPKEVCTKACFCEASEEQTPEQLPEIGKSLMEHCFCLTKNENI